MAKIQIVADTETKEFTCSINGTIISDIADVSIYNYRDSNNNVNELNISLSSTVKTIDGVEIRVSYYAFGSEQAKSAIASRQKIYDDIEGFVGIAEKSQVAKDIDNFLSS